ncbi:uncharacterized protein EI97DRAFT_290596 [Westerdykella ornata]|uniref:Uncharacterized protein n=1 Tax=Westerdykella ornata TaxID=318751 RepID=A0A6A6JMG6_WESOR|nr:uncharacterized protein EI97DRAFT_290596 [Westerdykella ornata]KAF2277415.1 hypothetical protein EI97DRAFT_290596 [Westerdykella ornata]
MRSPIRCFAISIALGAMSIVPRPCGYGHTPAEILGRTAGNLPAASNSNLDPMTMPTATTCVEETTSVSTAVKSPHCSTSSAIPMTTSGCLSDSGSLANARTHTSTDDLDYIQISISTSAMEHCVECKSASTRLYTKTVSKNSTTANCVEDSNGFNPKESLLV